MPGPSDLPFEIINLVVGFAADGPDDYKRLCSYSLVSRQWYSVLHARIYSKWLYDGAQHSIISLWKFLRTLLCSRRHADRLNIVDIRTWTVTPHGSHIFFSDTDLFLLRNSIRVAGLDSLESSFMNAIQKTDPRPLMALLLAHARNLNVLYAELQYTDIFFAEVLRKATAGQQHRSHHEYSPLSNLREAYLASAGERRWSLGKTNKLEPSHLSPIFQLPSIQKLSVYGLDSYGASKLFENSSKSSSVTELILVHLSDFQLVTPNTAALLALPTTLTKLSINLNDSLRGKTQISNAELWSVIQKYEHSIEHLDIYRQYRNYGRPKDGSRFGSMKRFKRLHNLYVQPELILGGCCFGIPIGPLQLVDALPPYLRSLTLYGYGGLFTNKTIGRQLRDVVRSRDNPDLTNIVVGEVGREGAAPEYPVYIPYDEIERACEENGITFKKSDDTLSCGGLYIPYNRSTQQRHRRVGINMRSSAKWQSLIEESI